VTTKRERKWIDPNAYRERGKGGMILSLVGIEKEEIG
jgi:hypothetical protein